MLLLQEIFNKVKGKRLYHIVFIGILTILLSSCNVSRFVPQGKYLVTKNTVIIEKKGTNINKSTLASYIHQKPYKDFLQTNIPTWIYFKSERNPKNVIWRWLNENFGKAPVYYEQSEALNSAKQMTLYLDNVGYPYSTVTSSVKTKRKKATVTYHVTPSTPYRINHIKYEIGDSLIERYIMRNPDLLLAKEGDIFNTFTLNDERDRITDWLKNLGYYYFHHDLIHYEVDSNFMDHKMDVTMIIPSKKPYTRRYLINNINVIPNKPVFNRNEKPIDSALLTYDIKFGTRKLPNTLHYYYYDRFKVTPQTISQSIQLIKGAPYRQRNVSLTYRNLSNFAIFSNVNIDFDTIPTHTDSIGKLDCTISMTQNNLHSITVQAEGTNSGGDLGIKGSVSYTNKNIFNGAEVFQLSLRSGLEAQTVMSLNDTQTESVFNTTELGVTASIRFPKFLSPFPVNSYSRDYQPSTTIALGLYGQKRYYYTRATASASLSYDWKSSYRFGQTLSPIYLNSVRLTDINPSFQALLDQEVNQRKKDQYTNHLILGSRYAFTLNTQNIRRTGSFLYLRGEVETSGNLISLFNNTKLITEENGHHKLFGIRYAQYVRSSLDFRQHIDLGHNSWLVMRQFVGLGIPYGNSIDLPFERSFYAGGSNGLRGWIYRGVGPGAYKPSSQNLERIGDMQLEFNAEYRFPLYNIINGALFFDAGNVWTYSPNPSLPDGEFKFDQFYKQIALDAGIGFRIDISFLILRLDFAYAMRNPYQDENGSYWTFHQPKSYFQNIRANMGIGYPF